MTPYYITTPIYYVNDVPHIGHAYTSVAADVLARFMRLAGRPVWYLTGTDEHGQKVEKTACDAGEKPQDFVDRVSDRFRHMGEALTLSNDQFIRTTDPAHKKAAQALWQQIEARGFIYKSIYAGWYAVRDEAFYQEKELVDGKAPTGAAVEWVEEESYFFKLSAFQEPLLAYYAAHPHFIGPDSRRNEVLSFVKSGLHDLSISRSTFSWGVPVPGDEKHVMYVWMDALTNYISALGFPGEGSKMQDFWPQAVHVMGKDIIRFHAVYWPAFLMAAGLPLPKRVFAHGWWTNNGQKISKSLGNAIDPLALAAEVGVDPLRYFLMREVPFGNDGDFSRASLIQRINSDLANDYGNLSQRVLSFVQKNAGAQVPVCGPLLSQDEAILAQARALPEILMQLAESQAVHKMAEAIWALVAEGNRYVDAEQPWALRKTDTARMETVLYVLMDVLRYMAVLASPFIPTTAAKLMDQLALSAVQRTMAGFNIPLVAGTPLPIPQGLFPRLEA